MPGIRVFGLSSKACIITKPPTTTKGGIVEEPKIRLLGKQVYCVECANKHPPKMRPSVSMVRLRSGPYDLCPDDLNIDKRLIGVCLECLADKNAFQRSYAIDIDIDHRHLVRKNA